MTLYGKIKKLRKEKGLTQKELAERLSINMSHLNRIENGKCQPSIDMLKKFSEYFGISNDYLLSDEEFPEVHVENKSLLERVKLIDSLDQEDQKALMHFIDSMLTKKRMKELLERPAV